MPPRPEPTPIYVNGANTIYVNGANTLNAMTTSGIVGISTVGTSRKIAVTAQTWGSCLSGQVIRRTVSVPPITVASEADHDAGLTACSQPSGP